MLTRTITIISGFRYLLLRLGLCSKRTINLTCIQLTMCYGISMASPYDLVTNSLSSFTILQLLLLLLSLYQQIQNEQVIIATTIHLFSYARRYSSLDQERTRLKRLSCCGVQRGARISSRGQRRSSTHRKFPCQLQSLQCRHFQRVTLATQLLPSSSSSQTVNSKMVNPG